MESQESCLNSRQAVAKTPISGFFLESGIDSREEKVHD